MRKFLSIIGIIASLSAAEGLHRFGTFVGAMHGGDTPFYMVALVVALIAAVFFILALVGKLSGLMKWIAVVLLVVSTGLMLFAPAFPVIIQILVSLAVAALCMVFAPIITAQTENENVISETPSKFGKIFKRVVVTVVIIVIVLAILGKVITPKKPNTNSEQQTQTAIR